MGVIQTLFMVMTTIVCAFFISFFGLIMNLLLPNFNWTTEVVVIKQSAATMIALFTGMGIVGVQYLFLLFLPSIMIAYSSYCMLIVIIDVMLYHILMTYGKKRFNTL
jgi:ABC-2 type transport system permease protein